MNTSKVLKKINSSNLFEKITIEENKTVTATFKGRIINDVEMIKLLELFPSKKYDLRISFVDGKIQVKITLSFINRIGKGDFSYSPTWPRRMPDFFPPFPPRF